MENKDVYKWKESTEFNQTLINQSMIESSKKRARRTKFIRKVRLCSMLLVPLLTFTILVNTSQQFVSAMNDVPFLNKIVDIFKYNPSIYLARNTDIYQKIDKTYKTDKYILYIESMVVDEDQISGNEAGHHYRANGGSQGVPDRRSPRRCNSCARA